MSLKEILKDESKRKIVLLFLYLFVMFVLVLMVRINRETTPINSITKTDEVVDNVSAIDKLKYTNYQYQYIITNDLENYSINGTRYNDEEIFTISDKNYFLKQNEIYEINGYSLELTSDNVFHIKSEEIYNLIYNVEPIIELNIGDEIQKEYEVTTINEDVINIKTIEKDKYITKVEMNYILPYTLKVIINYDNVNKINKLNTNFKGE